MRIDSQHTIAAAEKLLTNLDGFVGDVSLQIATRSHGQVGGGEDAMVQALITWAQQQEAATLVTYAQNAHDEQLSTFVRHIVGLSAALLCDSASSRAGDQLSAALRSQALDRQRELQRDGGSPASRGMQFEILCADHLSLPPPTLLYDPSGNHPRLRGEKAFRELGRLIVSAGIVSGGNLGAEIISAIGETLYELFRNTEEHARLDVAGNHLRRSLRGIHARRHDKTPDELQNAIEASPRLQPFAARLRPLPRRKKVTFAEFSVFDSGPGLACRWLKEEDDYIAPDLEIEAINKCFAYRATTKTISGRGTGLPIVIAALRERGGLIRVRSGRQSLYADLWEERSLPFEAPPVLRPWSDRLRLARARGTLITFMIPLGSTE